VDQASGKLDRRSVLRAALASSLASTLTGCELWRESLSPFCPADPRYSDARTPLTIDVHAHVFNASDLQIDAFLRRIIARGNPAIRELGPVLQEMGWSSAPDANDERRALMAAATELKECRQSVRINQVEGFRQNGYARGRAELQRALSSAQAKRRIGARRLLDDSSVAAAITSCRRARRTIERRAAHAPGRRA
jgi:hypothetical protein